MGTKVTTPSTTTWTETELQAFIAWVEKAQVGKINMAFSNMDNTSEPKIQAGSVVEIAGALYQFGAEEAATGWGGISNDTQAYMKLVTSGTDVTAEWTTVAPVWRDDLQGWYESGTDERYILRCYKDASGDYTEKAKYTIEHGNRWLEGATFSGDNTFSGANTFTGDSDFTRIPVASGTEIARRNDKEVTTGSSSYVEIDSTTLYFHGTVNVYLEQRSGTTIDSDLRVLKNGSVEASWSTNSDTYVTRTVDVTVVPGDVISIEHKEAGGGGTSYCRNRRIRIDSASTNNMFVYLWIKGSGGF